MGPRALRALVVAGCVTAVATAAWYAVSGRGVTAARTGEAIDPGRPLAAVLVPTRDRSASVVVVDLGELRVVRRVRLRSMASEMALDPASGRIVTAQCGGVGSDSDDAAGVLDPRSGSLSYVRLARPNPTGAAMLDGRAYLLHGWTDAGRAGTFFVSVVDPLTSRPVRTGHVPESLGLWSAAAERLWSVGRDEAGVACPLLSIAPSDLSTSVVLAGGRPVNAVIDGDRAVYLLITLLPSREATSGSVLEVDPTTLRVTRTARLSGLCNGATKGAATATRLAVIDDLGEGESSHAITLVDRETLRVVRTVRVPGAPAAVASWRERFVVVDREGGRLLVLSARDGLVTGSVDLGERDLLWTDVEVLPAVPGVSGP